MVVMAAMMMDGGAMHEVKLCTRSLPPKEVALLLSLVNDDQMATLPLASLELTLPSSSNGRSSGNRSRSTFKDQLKQTNNHNLLAGSTDAPASNHCNCQLLCSPNILLSVGKSGMILWMYWM
jgi:hypothetical protein